MHSQKQDEIASCQKEPNSKSCRPGRHRRMLSGSAGFPEKKQNAGGQLAKTPTKILVNEFATQIFAPKIQVERPEFSSFFDTTRLPTDVLVMPPPFFAVVPNETLLGTRYGRKMLGKPLSSVVSGAIFCNQALTVHFSHWALKVRFWYSLEVSGATFSERALWG